MQAMTPSFMRFLDRTQWHTTVSRTPLDEWSAWCRELWLTTHNTHNRQTSTLSAGFGPAISAGKQPQTHALDCLTAWQLGLAIIFIAVTSNVTNWKHLCYKLLVQLTNHDFSPRYIQELVTVYNVFFYVFPTMHHSIGYFLEPTLMHTSIWTWMSHYPRHVSGLDMPIFRRNNCTNTASSILALLGSCTLHRLRAV